MLDKYCAYSFFCDKEKGKKTIKNYIKARYLKWKVRKDLKRIKNFSNSDLLELTWIIRHYKENHDDEIFLDGFKTSNFDSFCKISFRNNAVSIVEFDITSRNYNEKMDIVFTTEKSTIRTESEDLSSNFKYINTTLALEFGYTINTILDRILKEADL